MSNQLELHVREVARRLYDEQVAFLFKVPEEWTQTPCDFFGHTRSGRAILMECKQVKRSNLPMHCKPGLAPHQRLALRQASACGAIAYVVWQNGDKIALLKFHHAEELARGRESIPWQDGAELHTTDDLFETLRLLLDHR